MKILFGYDSEELAAEYLSAAIATHGKVTIFSSNVSPSADVDPALFSFGTTGSIVLIDLNDALERPQDFSEFDEFFYIGNADRDAFPHERFTPFTSSVAEFRKGRRVKKSIVREHKKKVRASDVAKGFSWGGSIFQTRPTDLTLIAGRATKILALRSLGSDHDAFGWRTANNKTHVFTATEFLQFAIAVDEHVEQQYVKSWSKPQ